MVTRVQVAERIQIALLEGYHQDVVGFGHRLTPERIHELLVIRRAVSLHTYGTGSFLRRFD